MSEMIKLQDVAKSFTMHLRDGARIPVVANVSFGVDAGECVVLGGPSGAGKSSVLKMIFGNYRCDSGAVLVADEGTFVDVASAPSRRILRLRQTSIGYVSQFLRVIPRVAAIDIVSAAAASGTRNSGAAKDVAMALLRRLNVPERLWSLPPATFSGGEQQRINIARGFAADRPILLMDEPTASLDADNRQVVIELIAERKATGTAILGIFHDSDVRDAVADRVIDVTQFSS